MTVEIGLREYSGQIAEAIDNGRYATAVSNAKHVLAQYPKCLSIYRLTARAALEAGQYEFAIDLLRRVLSGNPEDVAAWAGISEVYDRRGELDAAIFCLHRAVELTAGSGPVETELRGLYGKRDGAEPKKVTLTPATLARVYLKGGLLSRAIGQFRDLQSEAPERDDLSLGLAEALWRNDERVEAAQVCLDVLERLPYCLKANLILGEMWTSGGREGGVTYLHRAEALDPENAMAQVLFGPSSPLPPKQVQVTLRETQASDGEELPDWLAGVVGVPGSPEPTSRETEVLDIAAALEAQIEIPPWLEEVGLGDEMGVPALPMPDGSTVVSRQAFERELQPPAEPAPVAEDLPPWLAELRPESVGDDDSISAPAVVQAMPSPPPGFAPASAALKGALAAPVEPEPAWLAGLGLEDMDDDDLPLAEEDDESAEWLAEISREPADGQPAIDLPGGGADEAPEWLAALAAEPAAPTAVAEGPAVVEADVPTAEGELPEWLAAAVAQPGVEPVIDAGAVPGGAEGELPDWLAEMGVQAADDGIDLAAGGNGVLFEEQAKAWVEGLAARQEEGPPTSVPAETDLVLDDLAGLAGRSDEDDVAADIAAPVSSQERPAAEAAEAFGWTLFGTPEPEPEPAAWAEEPAADVKAPPEAIVAPADDDALDWTAIGVQEAPLIGPDMVIEPGLEDAAIPSPETLAALGGDDDFGWTLLGMEEAAPFAPEPGPVVTAAPPVVEAAAAASEGAFGWTAFGDAGPALAAAIDDEAAPQAAPPPFADGPEAAVPAPALAVEEDWGDMLADLPEEEAVAPAGLVEEEPVAPRIPTVEEPEVAVRPVETTAAAPAADQFAAERAYLKQKPRDYEAWLSLARELWRAQQPAQALDAYGRLIRSGELLDKVISDLEKRGKKTKDASARRALGDAYMKAGRLDDALDTYRQTLEGL
ncbi:MAG: tetratricopeptide repeat protein [Anaerolineales bacterium]|nr:MAG: tetratricopeptide repeat protein [Anaerolineales bacterium]